MTSPRASRRLARPRGDAGSGTAWVLALTAVIALAAVLLIGLVEVRVLRAQAAAAADLAALAGAARLPDPAAACQAARLVAEAQRSLLVACHPVGLTLDVAVSRALTGPLSGLPAVTVRARAGPPARP